MQLKTRCSSSSTSTFAVHIYRACALYAILFAGACGSAPLGELDELDRSRAAGIVTFSCECTTTCSCGTGYVTSFDYKGTPGKESNGSGGGFRLTCSDSHAADTDCSEECIYDDGVLSESTDCSIVERSKP